jgi:hypothetical protein
MGRNNGPDDLGDDEQETEIAEYAQFIEDPPDGEYVIAEDDDDDAEADADWAAAHPRAAAAEPDPGDMSAEQAAVHEIPGT